ncbi:FAD-binding oxidoreductase [Providencia rettgeri]
MKEDFLSYIASRVDGECVVRAKRLPDNVSAFRRRKIKGILRPNSLIDLQQIVIGASEFPNTRLHPVSIGYNWGLGSREDVADGSYLVELQKLNAVRKIDTDQGWAIIEPGVTQGELSELLIGTQKMLNITASSAHSSFLGNALDRGVGLRHQRTEDLVGIEVLLPTGKIIRIGWWPGSVETPIYPHGVGPSLVQFFTQSSFGVVTAGVIKLHTRPESTHVVRFNFSRKLLSPAIQTLKKWVANGLSSGVLKIYDTTANSTYGGSDGLYTVHLCVDGLSDDVSQRIGLIKKLCESSQVFTNVTSNSVTEGNYPGPDVIANLVEAAHVGDSSLNDTLLRKTLGARHDKVDTGGTGWIFFLPLIPFTADALEMAYQLIDEVHNETGVLCGATINALSGDVIDLVVSIAFKKSEKESADSLTALSKLHEKFTAQGFIPYRLGVEHAKWADPITPGVGERSFVRELKQFIDPNNIISNDRYL